MATGSCAPARGLPPFSCPKWGACQSPFPPPQASHCLIRIHLASRRRRAYVSRHAPAQNCRPLLALQRPSGWKTTGQTVSASRHVSSQRGESEGRGGCRNAREKEGGRRGWMRGSERAGSDGSSEATAVCRGSRPRRAGMSDPTRRIPPGERSPLPSRTAEKHRGLQGFPPHKLVSSSCFLPHKISSISSLIALYKQTWERLVLNKVICLRKLIYHILSWNIESYLSLEKSC